MENEGRQLEYQMAGTGEAGAELVIAERQEPAVRGPDGRYLPGHPPTRNALTAAQREALEEIRALAPKVAERMNNMLDDKTVPAVAKIRIMEIILERTYGKPEATVRLNADVQANEAGRARLEVIAARIRLEVD